MFEPLSGSMELPAHYFPVGLCAYTNDHLPNAWERKKYTKFTDYGSHGAVDLSFSEASRKVTFVPQYSQMGLRGLSSSGYSLPLLERPLQAQWQLSDFILGGRSYPDSLLNMQRVLCGAADLKMSAGRKKFQEIWGHKMQICQRLLKKMVALNQGQGSGEVTDPKYASLCSQLRNNLSSPMKTFLRKHSSVQQAYNENCLQGFNSDFHGGLLSHVTTDNPSQHILVHAGGGEHFRDIYMTKVTPGEHRSLYRSEVLKKTTCVDPVFQISTASKHNSFICVRSRHKCVLIGTDTEDPLEEKAVLDLEDEILSCVDPSPYVDNEIVMSNSTGTVYLWDIKAGKKKLLVKQSKSDLQDRWTWCYFAGHPRQVVVADNKSVEMYDHRTKFLKGTEIFGLSPKFVRSTESVRSACNVGFPNHCVVTDNAVFLMDQRFPAVPVLSWNHELMMASPQYVKVFPSSSLAGGPTDRCSGDKLLLVGAQQPAEVMCYPISVKSSSAPTASFLPFRVSRPGEFAQRPEVLSQSDADVVGKRFDASLAGVTALPALSCQGFTVYQMDSYGEIFYKPHLFRGRDLRSGVLEMSSKDEAVAISRGCAWVSTMEAGYMSDDDEDLTLEYTNTTLSKKIAKDIFSSCGSEEEKEDDHIAMKKKLRKKMLRNKKKGVKSKEFVQQKAVVSDSEDAKGEQDIMEESEDDEKEEQEIAEEREESKIKQHGLEKSWTVDIDELPSDVKVCPDSPALLASGLRLAGVSGCARKLTYCESAFTGVSSSSCDGFRSIEKSKSSLAAMNSSTSHCVEQPDS
ncbi:uncharacterized protein LOC101861922 [Aplysia californica]|uniref:Uncharacterized protein LOC101861922 n=1 Tax=Aplysia californica TaxID=6500 RepID=A0ABM0JBQ6_APLCA|nr:uncharacterized protein LOC101861922 [Aplysia californica]